MTLKSARNGWVFNEVGCFEDSPCCAWVCCKNDRSKMSLWSNWGFDWLICPILRFARMNFDNYFFQSSLEWHSLFVLCRRKKRYYTLLEKDTAWNKSWNTIKDLFTFLGITQIHSCLSTLTSLAVSNIKLAVDKFESPSRIINVLHISETIGGVHSLTTGMQLKMLNRRQKRILLKQPAAPVV